MQQLSLNEHVNLLDTFVLNNRRKICLWGQSMSTTQKSKKFNLTHQILTLILLMWRIGWAPNNARKWQVGFNSAFKGLKFGLFDSLFFLYFSCEEQSFTDVSHHQIFRHEGIRSLIYW